MDSRDYWEGEATSESKVYGAVQLKLAVVLEQ